MKPKVCSSSLCRFAVFKVPFLLPYTHLRSLSSSIIFCLYSWTTSPSASNEVIRLFFYVSNFPSPYLYLSYSLYSFSLSLSPSLSRSLSTSLCLFSSPSLSSLPSSYTPIVNVCVERGCREKNQFKLVSQMSILPVQLLDKF